MRRATLTAWNRTWCWSEWELVRKGSVLEVAKTSELFDKIHEAHISGRHCGRDKMHADLAKRFSNIGQKAIAVYLGTCETCEEKRKRPRKGVVSKPILSDDLCSRGQVDLICFESERDQEFCYILTYQDHLTKFISLRALKSKRAEEVAYQLLDIFCTFGAPAILQVSIRILNGSVMCTKILVWSKFSKYLIYEVSTTFSWLCFIVIITLGLYSFKLKCMQIHCICSHVHNWIVWLTHELKVSKMHDDANLKTRRSRFTDTFVFFAERQRPGIY